MAGAALAALAVCIDGSFAGGAEDLDAFIDGSRSLADGWIGHYLGRTIEQYKEERGTIADAIHQAFPEPFREKTPDILRPARRGTPERGQGAFRTGPGSRRRSASIRAASP